MIKGLESEGHKIVYYIGNAANHGEEPDFSGIVYHEDYEARFGKPAKDFKDSNFPPPENELLSKLYKAESLFLIMSNRKLDTPDKSMTTDEKRHFFYDLVRYWHGILLKFEPNVIIFPAVPHNVSNFTIYSLAKILGIKTIFFQETWASDRILMQYSYDNTAPLLPKALEKHAGKNYTADDLELDLKVYYTIQTTPELDATPIDVKELLDERNKTTVVKKIYDKFKFISASLRDLSIFEKAYRSIKRHFEENLKTEYESLEVVPDLNKNFIYVPLHWQPECTTSPLGEKYADQLLMLETLSYSLPSGWKIYVKEHPFQWSIDGVYNYTNMRYRGYYKKMAALPNIFLLPVSTNTFELEPKARAVATVAGRAALEGIYRGTPALIFGNPWYMNMPGLFRIGGTESCKKALNKINGGYRPDKKEVLRYLKAFGEVSVRGYLEPLAKENSSFTPKETMEHILSILLPELEE